MPQITVNIIGGDYQHKAKSLSSQRTRNFWPQQQTNNTEKSTYILQSFYGSKSFAAKSGYTSRGLFVNNGVLYRVLDDRFYSVAADGTHTEIGRIPGSDRCIFSASGDQVTIVSERIAYNYDGTTFKKITDENLGNPNSCACVNQQTIYDTGSGQTFHVSNVGDPTTIYALNSGSAESDSSPIVRIYAFKQTVYMMKKASIELWWNSGQGNPPFSRIQGGVVNVGLDAKDSVAESNDYLFFFGVDKQVHAITGGSAAVDTVISNAAMASAFQGYSKTDDAFGWVMKIEGVDFYLITFPSEDITWAYPVGGEWFEIGSGASGKSRIVSYAYFNNMHIVDDSDGGDLFQLAPDVYTEDSETISRMRISAPISGEAAGVPGHELEMNSLEIIAETGTGVTSDPGIDPVIMVSFSDDGGKTYGPEIIGRLGREGKYRRVKWRSLGRFYERTVKIVVSDPVYWAILSATAEMDTCI